MLNYPRSFKICWSHWWFDVALMFFVVLWVTWVQWQTWTTQLLILELTWIPRSLNFKTYWFVRFDFHTFSQAILERPFMNVLINPSVMALVDERDGQIVSHGGKFQQAVIFQSGKQQLRCSFQIWCCIDTWQTLVFLKSYCWLHVFFVKLRIRTWHGGTPIISNVLLCPNHPGPKAWEMGRGAQAMRQLISAGVADHKKNMWRKTIRFAWGTSFLG